MVGELLREIEDRSRFKHHNADPSLGLRISLHLDFMRKCLKDVVDIVEAHKRLAVMNLSLVDAAALRWLNWSKIADFWGWSVNGFFPLHECCPRCIQDKNRLLEKPLEESGLHFEFGIL